MSDFIKKKRKRFENGNAFYEYDPHQNDEELMYYKDRISVISFKVNVACMYECIHEVLSVNV